MVSLARDYRGLTQTDLADRLGTKQGVISKVEGGITSITEDMLGEFSRVLDFPAPASSFSPIMYTDWGRTLMSIASGRGFPRR